MKPDKTAAGIVALAEERQPPNPRRWLVLPGDWIWLLAICAGTIIGVLTTIIGLARPLAGVASFLTVFAIATVLESRDPTSRDISRRLRIALPGMWLLVAGASMAVWLGALLWVAPEEPQAGVAIWFFSALTFARILARGIAGSNRCSSRATAA